MSLPNRKGSALKWEFLGLLLSLSTTLERICSKKFRFSIFLSKLLNVLCVVDAIVFGQRRQAHSATVRKLNIWKVVKLLLRGTYFIYRSNLYGPRLLWLTSIPEDVVINRIKRATL